MKKFGIQKIHKQPIKNIGNVYEYFGTVAILAEDEKVILKAVSDEDYSNYMEVSYECSVMKSAFKEEDFKKDLWESFLEDTAANYTVFDKATGESVWYCGIKNLKTENWELVVELLEKYRHQGYGYYALVAM